MAADLTWSPIATAPREWTSELSVNIPEPVVTRSGRCIMARGMLDGEEVEEIVHWSQIEGTAEPCYQNTPHWFIFDAEPLGWEPTEWRNLTPDEEAELDGDEDAAA